MRMLVVALVSFVFLGATPGAQAVAEVLASRGDVAAPGVQVATSVTERKGALAESRPASLASTQELATGALVVGGAFVVGLVAGGTLSTAIVSAGAVILIYGLLP